MKIKYHIVNFSVELLCGAYSGCGWRKWPLDMEGSCEYIEQAVVYSHHVTKCFIGAWVSVDFLE
jgi:hypothetical protein